MITGDNVSFSFGLASEIPSTKEPGTFRICTDDGSMYLDVDLDNRIQLGGGASGGDYLPITGGTITGDLIIKGAIKSGKSNKTLDILADTLSINDVQPNIYSSPLGNVMYEGAVSERIESFTIAPTTYPLSQNNPNGYEPGKLYIIAGVPDYDFDSHGNYLEKQTSLVFSGPVSGGPGKISLHGKDNTIHNCKDPIESLDVANKHYVDEAIAQLQTQITSLQNANN